MAYRKLGRTSSQRKAMLRDLTTDLLINESIVTTEARAKEIRKTVEKMITLGKRGDLHARRQAAAFVRNEIASENYDEATDKYTSTTALQKLFSEIAPRYAERNGGYTRILKTEPRRGDAAPMAIIELVFNPNSAILPETPATIPDLSLPTTVIIAFISKLQFFLK